ncbi:hypothetical protein PIB30_113182, partial [Stylosanthes scabra]|nr:hypothetical protein [Stylosanthes scabra]
EDELMKQLSELRLGIKEDSQGVRLAQLQITSAFKKAIQQSQSQESAMNRLVAGINRGLPLFLSLTLRVLRTSLL